MTGAFKSRSIDSGGAGFTLIELLVTLSILATVAYMALPRVSLTKSRVSFHSLTLQLAAELRATRAAAQWSNVERSISIDFDAHTYWSDARPSRQQIPREISLELSGFDIPTTSSGTTQLRFRPDGSTAPRRILLWDGRRSAVVTVDGLTGSTQVAWTN